MKQSLLQELENAKRNLQEVTSQIKSIERLIEEEQASTLQFNDQEVTNLKMTVQNLEKEISAFKLNPQEAVSEYHNKLAEQNRIISELEKELEDLQRQSVTDNVKNSTLDPEQLHKENENQLLQDELNNIINIVSEEEKLLNKDLKRYESLKEELNGVYKVLTEKKNELVEKNEHIDILKEELLAVNTQKNFIQPAVIQKENIPTSTSLFSEVNERRITTQETLNSMKSNFLKIVDEQGKLHKKLSHLQCENSKLKLLYNSTSLNLEDCKAPLKNSLNSQLRMLKELLKMHEEKLNGEEETLDNNCTTYKLFDQAMELVEAEVNLFKEKVSNWYLSEHMLSSSLFKVNQEIETLQKTVEMLETENNIISTQILEENDTFDEQSIVGEHLESNSPTTRKCLEAVNQNIQEELKGINMLRGSDHKYSVDLINENPRRNVRFTENTVSSDSQVPPPRSFKGRKVFVLPKKQ